MDNPENFDNNSSAEWMPHFSGEEAVNPQSGLPADAPTFMESAPFPSQQNTPYNTGPDQYGSSNQYVMPPTFPQAAMSAPAPQAGFYPYPYAGAYAFPTYQQDPSHPFYTPMNTSSQNFPSAPALQLRTENPPLGTHGHTPTSAGGSVTSHNYSYQERQSTASPTNPRKRGATQDSVSSPAHRVKRIRGASMERINRTSSPATFRTSPQRFEPLNPLCEQQIDVVAGELALEVKKKADALSELGKRSTPEMMQRIFLKIMGKMSSRNPTEGTSILSANTAPQEGESSHEGSEILRRTDDMQRFHRAVISRRHSNCHPRSVHGALPCLRPGCPGRWEDKGAWVRHIAQLIPDRLWICHFCKEIHDRKERLEVHLKNNHKDESPEARHHCAAQEFYKVPFHGHCGFCNFESDNWTFFWLNHVYEHLIGKNGPLCTKEQWNQPYPLPYEPGSHHRSRIPPDFHDKFPARGDDDFDDDDDENDDGFGPGGGGAPRNPNAYRSRSGSQRSFDHHKTQTQYSSHHTGTSYASNTQEQLFPNKSQPPNGLHLSERSMISLEDSNPRQYLQISEWPYTPSDEVDDQNRCRQKTLSTLSTFRYGIDKQYPPYAHVRTLFRGTTTVVDQVRHQPSGTLVVRKRVRNPDKTASSLQDLFAQEVGTMKRLSHPHVISLVDQFLAVQSYSLFVVPVGELTLKQFLEAPPSTCENSLRRWHHCLSSAVSYLHADDVGICHLDIKPSNIMIAGSSIFLGDFGIARKNEPALDSPSCQRFGIPQSMPMTPMYAAPELIEQGLWSRMADIWALGCVFLEMATILCHVSIQKFYNFLTLVRQQTRGLARHDSWEVGRMLWSWVLKWRFKSSVVQRGTDIFLKRSLRANESMLQHNPRKRPSIQTLSKTFIALKCCSRKNSEQQMTVSRTADGFSESQLLRLSIQSSKYLFTFQATAITHGNDHERPKSIMRRHSDKPRTSRTPQTLSKVGEWMTQAAQVHRDASLLRDPFKGSSESVLPQASILGQDSDRADAAHMRKPRKSGSWPLSRTERKALALTGSSFYTISGDFHVKREAEDFKSYEVKWSGWSSLCHNVVWEQTLGDSAFLHSIVEHQLRRNLKVGKEAFGE